MQTAQNRSPNPTVTTPNTVTWNLWRRNACRRFGNTWSQAGVWAASVVMSYPLLENLPHVSLVVAVVDEKPVRFLSRDGLPELLERPVRGGMRVTLK